jgi:hypothetical protein
MIAPIRAGNQLLLDVRLLRFQDSRHCVLPGAAIAFKPIVAKLQICGQCAQSRFRVIPVTGGQHLEDVLDKGGGYYGPSWLLLILYSVGLDTRE